VSEGFDPSSITDPVYFRDDAQRRYTRLDHALYEAIIKGKVRI
jgi:hypothetical protein